jgi:uncharacterized LabA/DUF88 family protein
MAFDRGPTKRSNVLANKRIALFIDGANFYVSTKVVGFDMDWKRFIEYYEQQGDFIRAYYYSGIIPRVEGEHDSMRGVLDWISYNRFQLRSKPAKVFIDPVTQRRTVKGNMDIEICIDAWNMAPHITDMYLFSGDGDFIPLVEKVQSQGVRVHVISTTDEKNSMCADGLRRQCDNYYELATLVPHFRREARE